MLRKALIGTSLISTAYTVAVLTLLYIEGIVKFDAKQTVTFLAFYLMLLFVVCLQLLFFELLADFLKRYSQFPRILGMFLVVTVTMLVSIQLRDPNFGFLLLVTVGLYEVYIQSIQIAKKLPI